MIRKGVLFILVLLSLHAVLPVCQGQLFYSSDEQSVKVTVLRGQVSVLRDDVPWALKVGDWVRMRQIIVSGPDGFAALELSDGSKFEIYPDSRVTFRNNPASLTDLVDVWLGKIKIEIQRLTGQPNHNRIHTPTAVISVRGTSFFVDVQDDGDATLVVVEHGQVEVQHLLLPYGAPRILNEGEWLRVSRGEPLARQSVDRGSVLRVALRALSEALYTAMTYGGGGGTPSGGGGTPLPGDRAPGGGQPGEGQPPAPPPPPPPPPAN